MNEVYDSKNTQEERISDRLVSLNDIGAGEEPQQVLHSERQNRNACEIKPYNQAEDGYNIV